MLHSLVGDGALRHFFPWETLEIRAVKRDVELFSVIFDGKICQKCAFIRLNCMKLNEN